MRIHALLVLGICTFGPARAIDFTTANYWTSPYGGSWFSGNWSPSKVPTADRDIVVGYSGLALSKVFSGRITIDNRNAVARGVYSRGTFRLTSGQLNLFGDTEFPTNGGFEMTNSRIFVETSSEWKNTRFLANAGTNYLDIWYGQTLNLNGAVIRANGGHIRQSTWAYSPGNLTGAGLIEARDGGTIAMTGGTFSVTGSITAIGAGTSAEFAYRLMSLPPVLAMDGGFVGLYRSTPGGSALTADWLVAKNGGKIVVQASWIKYKTESYWNCEDTSELQFVTDEVAAGTGVERTDIKAGSLGTWTGRGIHFLVNPGSEGSWSGGRVFGSELNKLKTYVGANTGMTRLVYVDFADPFWIVSNEFALEGCTMPNLHVAGSTVSLRYYDYNLNLNASPGYSVYFEDWGGRTNYWRQSGGILIKNFVEVKSPLVLWGTNNGTPAHFRNQGTMVVRGPVTKTPGVTFTNEGGILNLFTGANMPDMVSKGGIVGLIARTPIAGGLTLQDNATLQVRPHDDSVPSTAPVEGFSGGLNVTAGSTLELRLGNKFSQGRFMRSKGMTLGGKLKINAASLPEAISGTTYDVIAGPVAYGPGFSVDPVADWTVTTSPIGIWITKN